MKNVRFAVMLVTVYAIGTVAQDAKAPVTNVSGGASVALHENHGVSQPLASATNLVFYGGDINQSDPNEDGLANGNTLLVPTTYTYGAVTPPKGSKIVATGILFNQIPTVLGDVFDPPQATYDIRTGVSEGNGGKDLISGSGPQSAIPTGRIPLGTYTEFATSVPFVKPVSAAGGTTYWLNLESECTDSMNGNCGSLQFFVDNTTQQTNGINANLQPSSQMFFNSSYFGAVWENWCDPALGLNAQQCQYLSFGVYGPAGTEQVVFYSGDFDAASTFANGLLNENLAGQDGQVWVPFSVQKLLTVNYLFINELFNQPPPFAATAQWTISNGVSQGNAGTVQCKGTGTAYSAPTGRSFTFNSVTYTEYQYTMSLGANPCQLSSKAAANQFDPHAPPPTRGGCPGGCSMNVIISPPAGHSSGLIGFLSDVEDNPPLHHIGLPNINDDSFFSSTAFGINFEPASAEQGGACSTGSPLAITNVGCDMFSVGIGGTGQ